MKGRCDIKKKRKTHHILVFFRPAFHCYTLLATLVCLFLICSMTSLTIVFITPTTESQEISYNIIRAVKFIMLQFRKRKGNQLIHQLIEPNRLPLSIAKKIKSCICQQLGE